MSISRPQAEHLLRLHEELERLSTGRGPAKLALLLVALAAAAFVLLRVIELSLDSSVGAEFLLVLVISILLTTGVGVARMLRVRTLRREIAELEAVGRRAVLKTRQEMLASLWASHCTRRFPPGTAGSEVDGIDLVLLDDAVSGLVSRVVGGERLAAADERRLADRSSSLQQVLPNLHGEARDYFEALGQLAQAAQGSTRHTSE